MLAASSTTRVKPWLTEPAPLVAVIVIGYTPPVPAAGVPSKLAVPLPLSTKVRPVGKAPVSVKLGTGLPASVTVKLNDVPTMAVAESGLEIVGASPTVRVKVCWAVLR